MRCTGALLTRGFRRGGICPVVPAVEDHVQAQRDAGHDDEHVRQIEHGEAHEEEIEHVHDVAAEDAVDAVADRTGEHQHDRPAADLAVHDVAPQAEHRDGGEHEREEDEDPVRRVLEHAERSAVVVDVRQLQHARYERDVPGVERDVDGDPVFEPLVSDEDQDGYDGIPHSGSSLSDQDFGSG